jgi:ABC-2 type transport system ATP-binding protein
VGLAQAMLGNPKLILLDEPTDGVDPVGRLEIRQVIKRLISQGTTVFLNSHLLSEVEQVCDRVAIMHHGEILQQGTVPQLIAAVTGGQGAALHVRFSTSTMSEAAIKAVAARGQAAPADGGFIITVADKSAITALVDDLRSHKIEIYGVEPQHANLEDAFIRLINAQADKSLGGTR